MELHQIISVTATNEESTYVAEVDMTDKDGFRYTAPYSSRPEDTFGLAPAVRAAIVEWIGEGKEVKPYEPPTPEEIRAAMPPLQKWRFETMIDINGLREGIDQAIAGMPEPQRTIAINKRNYVPEFFRDDPLFEELGPALGMTPEQIDDMWEQALTL